MGHVDWSPPNPRIAPTSHPEPAPPPPPPPTTLSARYPCTPWMATQDTLCRTCVCDSGNSAGCQYKQASRIDSEGITKIVHSSESNRMDRVMAVLKADPNPASNCALQVPQRDVYRYFESAHAKAHYQSRAIIMPYVDGSTSLVSDTKERPYIPCAFTEAYDHLMTAIDGPETGASITSSLSVLNHIKTEILPGINTLQGSNKDLRLPVVDKDKDNLTPSGALSIGKAYELEFMHDEDTLCRTCVCGSGNSAGCQASRNDNEGITKIVHSTESNRMDMVMAVLKADPNPASKPYVDGSPSLVSDTKGRRYIPSAFAEAYIDGPETDVSFTCSLSVPNHNKDPRLPVVDKDKDNLTPSGALSNGKTYELKFMHDEVPYRSSEEREFPKTMIISGLSSASSWDEIAAQKSTPTLRNDTDLCIFIPGKSRTTEVPERQHIRKRGPVHDPSSKITKRSKVNGNTLDSRSKNESKQLIQARAKADKSSEEQEFPNTTLLSEISVLSEVHLDGKSNPRFDSAPSNYDDLYESVSTPGKSLIMEAPDTNVHQRKRGQPLAYDCSPKITKRPKVHGSKTSESNPKDDSRKLTQVFVHFGDTCSSLQVNLKTTTVRKLIFSALNRKGIRSCDAYLLYCGRVLEEAYLLSVFPIPKDASFRIIPRLRAGQDQMLITYKTFDVITKDMKPFYKVVLPPILRETNATGDVYMVFLSQAARVLVVQILIYLSYLHSEGWCFNGNFKITNFVFWNGIAMMHPDVTKVKATGLWCQRDMVKLGEEIEKMFKRSNFFPKNLGQFPGYVSHLVELLKKFPLHKWDSKTYRLCLSNHPALLSFIERINKYIGMDLEYDFMDANTRKTFSAAVGKFGAWEQSISQVEPLWDTYWHNPISSKQSRFGSEGVSWLAVGRNFFSHPNEKKRGSRKSTVPVGFTKEQAEAALAFYWKDNLAKFLFNIIDNFTPPAGIDIKLLCGNDLVDPDSRGGKSGGTEVGQLQS